MYETTVNRHLSGHAVVFNVAYTSNLSTGKEVDTIIFGNHVQFYTAYLTHEEKPMRFYMSEPQ